MLTYKHEPNAIIGHRKNSPNTTFHAYYVTSKASGWWQITITEDGKKPLFIEVDTQEKVIPTIKNHL